MKKKVKKKKYLKNISPTIDKQVDCLKNNFKINYIYYITTIFCLYALYHYKVTNNSMICIIITYILVSMIGYSIHYFTHYIQISEIYKKNKTITRSFPIVDNFIKKLFDIIDFHHIIHHNSNYENNVKVNKKWKNIIIEFLQNIFFQGIIIIIISKFLNYLDRTIILLWTLLYATVHNINYNIITPLTHIEHHINYKTNYGIDIYDIIFGTKYNWDNLENYNHISINTIIITFVIIYFYKYLKN